MKTAQHSGRVSKLTTLKGKQANALFWSPLGHYLILAGMKGFNGQLEFYNVDELETMATAEHFMHNRQFDGFKVYDQVRLDSNIILTGILLHSQ
ncbi:Eukaryotic translation initiation factor 3 subunit B [Linum perenne]